MQYILKIKTNRIFQTLIISEQVNISTSALNQKLSFFVPFQICYNSRVSIFKFLKFLSCHLEEEEVNLPDPLKRIISRNDEHVFIVFHNFKLFPKYRGGNRLYRHPVCIHAHCYITTLYK